MASSGVDPTEPSHLFHARKAVSSPADTPSGTLISSRRPSAVLTWNVSPCKPAGTRTRIVAPPPPAFDVPGGVDPGGRLRIADLQPMFELLPFCSRLANLRRRQWPSCL